VVEPAPLIAKRTILLGDSITEQYGAFYAALYPDENAIRPGGNSQDPSTHPWAKSLAAARPGDVIALQDYHADTDSPVEPWKAAWRTLVDVAVSTGARVVILVGHQPSQSNEAFFASLPAEHLDMVPADLFDCVHYDYAGSIAMAERLKTYLDEPVPPLPPTG